MPADRLREARDQVVAGQFSLAADMQGAVLARIDDLVEDISAADRALERLPHSAVAEAAARLAHVFYISGHSWHRYLAESAASARAGNAIASALRKDVEPVVARLAQTLTASTVRVARRGEAHYALTCLACGADAVTFTRARMSAESPEQLVVSSLSPVTVFRSIAGPRMADLEALLERGDASVVVGYLKETQPAGCDACCPVCGGTYCKAHTAVEAQWSGSWHEATYATCPLGHERAIE